MNTRKLLVLTLVLAVLAGGLWHLRASREGADMLTSESLRSFVPSGLAATVDAVDLTRPDNSTVRLEKRDGRWVLPALGGAPANASSIERMLTALVELRGEHRSSDPAVLGDYELLDEQAMSLILWEGGKERVRLLFGKGDFRHVFVREAGSPDVSVVPGAIVGQLGAYGPTLSPQFWIDGTLLSVSGSDVRELRLHAPGIDAVLSRQPSAGSDSANATAAPEWDFRQTAGKGLAQRQMEEILGVLERVPVTEAVYPANPGEAFPSHRLEVVTASGATVLEGAPDGDGFLVRVAGSPHLYRMGPAVFGRLFPAPDGTPE